MPAFFELTPPRLRREVEAIGLPGFTATQLLEWVYGKGIVDPQAMTNLSKSARAAVADHFTFYTSDVLAHQLATDGTQKLLLGWHEQRRGNSAEREPSTPASGTPLPMLSGSSSAAAPTKQTECVMIPTPSRRTACVSSQVGCPVGCRFCASGLGGLEGNLRAGQIVEQVHRLGRLPDVGRITNIVFMGMGEPLANFAAVTDAIRILNASWALNISARRITVSTVGMPAAIRKLADFELPVTLALSLHAPDDDLRRQIIPWAQYASIDDLIDACDEHFRRTGREITLEYILLGGFNDRAAHARQLARLAKRLRANINLIRYNEVRGLPFQRPRTEDVRGFQSTLREHGVNAHIRASRGRDIAAACGQLRHERNAPSTQPAAATADEHG